MTLLTRREAAKMLNLAEQTLAKWAMTGKYLPVIRIGRRTVRYRCADVAAFVDGCATVANRKQESAPKEEGVENE